MPALVNAWGVEVHPERDDNTGAAQPLEAVDVESGPAPAAVTLHAATWVDMIEGGALAQKALSVARGSQRVDLKRVDEIGWLHTVLRCFDMLAGGCPCGGALQQIARFFPLGWGVFAAYDVMWGRRANDPNRVGRWLAVASSVLLGVACWMGMGIIRQPANGRILDLVELRARSHLKLSSQESNVGPTSLTFYTKAVTVAISAFMLLILVGVFAAFLADPRVDVVVVLVLLVAFMASGFSMIITFQRWTASIGGHAHWWRRRVEAIVSANDVDDLAGKLQHLHALLRQPFVQLNHFSAVITLAEVSLLLQAAANAALVLGPPPESGDAVGKTVVAANVAFAVVTFFAILFWPVTDS